MINGVVLSTENLIIIVARRIGSALRLLLFGVKPSAAYAALLIELYRLIASVGNKDIL